MWYAALQVSGLTKLARRLRRGGLILCYHNVVAACPDVDTGPWQHLGLHMPLLAFERQMRWLAAHFDIIPLEEFVGRLPRGGSLRGAATVTFDDGYHGVFAHAWPLLRSLGIPATVFLVAQAPERDQAFWWDHADVLDSYSPARREHWLTKLQGDSDAIVASLAHGQRPAPTVRCCRPADWPTIMDAVRSGLRLGVHSATHRSLPALDERDLRAEVVHSRALIARRTGVAPEFFAYPYGLWNERVRRAVHSAGYRAAVTLDYGYNGATTDPWLLRRVNVPAGIADAAFQAWTAGLSLRPRRDS